MVITFYRSLCANGRRQMKAQRYWPVHYKQNNSTYKVDFIEPVPCLHYSTEPAYGLFLNQLKLIDESTG